MVQGRLPWARAWCCSQSHSIAKWASGPSYRVWWASEPGAPQTLQGLATTSPRRRAARVASRTRFFCGSSRSFAGTLERETLVAAEVQALQAARRPLLTKWPRRWKASKGRAFWHTEQVLTRALGSISVLGVRADFSAISWIASSTENGTARSAAPTLTGLTLGRGPPWRQDHSRLPRHPPRAYKTTTEGQQDVAFVDFQRVASAPQAHAVSLDQLYLRLLWLKQHYRIVASKEHLHPEAELILVFDPPAPQVSDPFFRLLKSIRVPFAIPPSGREQDAVVEAAGGEVLREPLLGDARRLVDFAPESRAGRIAIIIPNYDHAPFLEGAVSSALEQSTQADEILVVDDGSTDGSRALIERMVSSEPRLRAVFNEQNLGIVPTFANAVADTRSEFVAFLCADNRMHLRYVARSLRALVGDTSAESPTSICRSLALSLPSWRPRSPQRAQVRMAPTTGRFRRPQRRTSLGYPIATSSTGIRCSGAAPTMRQVGSVQAHGRRTTTSPSG